MEMQGNCLSATVQLQAGNLSYETVIQHLHLPLIKDLIRQLLLAVIHVFHETCFIWSLPVIMTFKVFQPEFWFYVSNTSCMFSPVVTSHDPVNQETDPFMRYIVTVSAFITWACLWDCQEPASQRLTFYDLAISCYFPKAKGSCELHGWKQLKHHHPLSRQLKQPPPPPPRGKNKTKNTTLCFPAQLCLTFGILPLYTILH